MQYLHHSPREQNCLGSVLRVMGVEVLTAVVMKGSVFFLCLFFDPEYGDDMFLRKAG
jgi:hypothetical protein